MSEELFEHTTGQGKEEKSTNDEIESINLQKNDGR